jgi:hypothetical protein
MITALLLAALAATPADAAAAGPAHAPAEAALLRTAFPDHDPRSGWLGHDEGRLIEATSACTEDGLCLLGVAARDAGEASAHAWSTFFTFRAAATGWVEMGHVAGPAVDTVGKWSVRVAIQLDPDGPFVTATNASGEGPVTTTHLWSWDGRKFLPVLSASSGRQGSTETETTFARCADRPSNRPSWEVRTREREGNGKWTETRVRVAWGALAWVERPADRPCGEKGGPEVAPATPAAPRFRSASASKTAAAPRGQPQATAPGNAIDGDRQTAWVAGGKKGGVGEWLQLELAAPTALSALQVVGSCPGADWKAGPRLKKVRLRYEDGPPQEAALADLQGPQSIAVARKAPARWVRIELLELHRGGKRPDACVTEVAPQAR